MTILSQSFLAFVRSHLVVLFLFFPLGILVNILVNYDNLFVVDNIFKTPSHLTSSRNTLEGLNDAGSCAPVS